MNNFLNARPEKPTNDTEKNQNHPIWLGSSVKVSNDNRNIAKVPKDVKLIRFDCSLNLQSLTFIIKTCVGITTNDHGSIDENWISAKRPSNIGSIISNPIRTKREDNEEITMGRIPHTDSIILP